MFSVSILNDMEKGAKSCDRIMGVERWHLEAGRGEASMPVPDAEPHRLVTGGEK